MNSLLDIILAAVLILILAPFLIAIIRDLGDMKRIRKDSIQLGEELKQRQRR